uniref:Probable U3 small nucleolar RNA-associated protein 11 n=1 Tax=Globodera pallida TaxID=36090 RepID=A0A183CGV6_GLOPA
MLKETEKQRRRLYAELGKRVERERELAVVLQKLELKKDLAQSRKSELRPKLIRKGDAGRAAIYKWKYERKK